MLLLLPRQKKIRDERPPARGDPDARSPCRRRQRRLVLLPEMRRSPAADGVWVLRPVYLSVSVRRRRLLLLAPRAARAQIRE